jgi:flagella basal body P-ring formation protein FlgA
MRCSRRSTRSFARLAAALAAVATFTAAGRAQDTGPDEARVRLAIERAVLDRIGPTAAVDVTAVTDLRLTRDAAALVAVPDPGLRADAPGRFVLFGDTSRRVRVGEATAVVSAVVDAVRVRRPVARGRLVEAGDMELVREPLEGRLDPPAAIDDVLGARARRDLVPGLRLTTQDVAVEPAVRSGDPVRVFVRVAGIEVSATAVAMQTGVKHDVILVANPESRQTLRGRITANGEVEVLNVR